MRTSKRIAGPYREVPVDGLREAFERSGLTSGELARRLGWTKPDGYRVYRQLGLTPHHSRGHVEFRQTMSYDRALEIANALGVDPVDVGL